MSQKANVPDTVHAKADELADERDMTIKEAIRHMCRSTEGYDV